MTFSTFLLGLMIALAYGAVYHFVRGGNGWRLLMFFTLSAFGFFAGQLFGSWREWYLFMLGTLNLGMGTVGSILFLVIGEWLAKIEVKKESGV